MHNSASGRLKRFGTPVTKQNFQEWNTVFIAEYDKIEEKETLARLEELSLKTKLGKGKVDRKLTGKRLFEMDTKMITSDAAFLAEMMAEEGDQVFGSSVHVVRLLFSLFTFEKSERVQVCKRFVFGFQIGCLSN